MKVLLLALLPVAAYGFAVCGDNSKKIEVENAINATVSLILAKRQPDWGWKSIITPVYLQIAAPKYFISRWKTSKFVEDTLKYFGSSILIEDQALMAFTSRALCINPRNVGDINLLQNVKNFMDEVLKKNTRVPEGLLVQYVLGLSSLSINGYDGVEQYLVDGILNLQNQDGSFGENDKLTWTTWFLRPIHSLRKMQNPKFNVTSVDLAVGKMRNFIIGSVTVNEAGDTSIGDRSLSQDALIGLWKSREPEEDPETWRCSDIMRTLGIEPSIQEDEDELGDRLMRLTATDLLDLGSPDYACIEPMATPIGYKPTCDHNNPSSCLPK